MEVTKGLNLADFGALPEDWRVVPIGDLAAKVGSGVTPTGGQRVYRRNGRPFVRSQNVGWGELWLDDMAFIDDATHSAFADTEIQAEDVFLNITGASIGRSAVADSRLIGGNVNQHVCIIRASEGKLVPRFLNLILLSACGQRQIESFQAGGNRQGLNFGQVRSLRMPLPPTLAEQRAIAEALGDVDALLAALDRLIAKKRDLKQAAMQQLLTGRTRLPGFSGEWATCQVRDVIERYFCGPSPTCEERNIRGDDEWGVLKTTCATVEAGWDWTAHKTLPTMFWGQTEIEVKIGDVIVTKAGPRHRVGVSAFVDSVPARVVPSGKMICLRPSRHRVEPLMLSAAIASRGTQQYLDERTTGMAESQVNFENDVLLSAPIRIPPLLEQAGIAATLSDLKAELDVLEARRDKTWDLKQAMMQELLTGRTRLVRSEAEPC
jgi:type I restriction enzyme S subunit